VLFHYFDRFLAEYEGGFEKEYGFLRPVIKEVVERYLDCGNPRCGFACIRCPDCHAEHLLMFSCRTRGFCPSCHAKRLEEWGEWMRETLLLDVPHRQVVFVIPKMLWTTWSLSPGSLPIFPTRDKSLSAASASTPTPIGGRSRRQALGLFLSGLGRTSPSVSLPRVGLR
jgi:hypothetical protein